ncbi:transposase, partial [Staphylococcus epidermidis]|uniref:transposase n=1 Tax=Staphylococcus epidermidis TaxID=1282 RepID=UPI0016435B94
MLLSIPPKLPLSSFLPYLKAKTTLIIFHTHPNLKYTYPNTNFSCKGFYLHTLPTNKNLIQNYIPNQLQQHILPHQISIQQYLHPFTPQEIKKTPKKYYPFTAPPKLLHFPHLSLPFYPSPLTNPYTPTTNHPFIPLLFIQNYKIIFIINNPQI